MTAIDLSNNLKISTWETAINNQTVISNLAGILLSGRQAAAYLFGQALSGVPPSLFGANDQEVVTREQASIEFPPDSGQRVSIKELSDALMFKYDVDPLLEYSQGIGIHGYSRADINLIIKRLNAEYSSRFTLTPLPEHIALDWVKTPEVSTETVDDTARLSQLLTSPQKAALVLLARQLKTVSQDWVQQMPAAATVPQRLVQDWTLKAGLNLNSYTTLAIPGQPTRLKTLLQTAENALGIQFASQFPDLFANGRLRLSDVNAILSVAREAAPTQANDLSDVEPIQGHWLHAGVDFNGWQAYVLYIADAISSLQPTNAGQVIGWSDSVFSDPFDATHRVSLNDLKALLPYGLDPFEFLTPFAANGLRLGDLNSFLVRVNQEFSLQGAAAYSLIRVQGQAIAPTALTWAQTQALHQAIWLHAPDLGDHLDELAQFRRVLTSQTATVTPALDVNRLNLSERKAWSEVVEGLQRGVLNQGLMQKLGFGVRLGFDEVYFFDAQGQPASLSTLLGGATSGLTAWLSESLPQVQALGLSAEDIQSVLQSAQGLSAYLTVDQVQDPARADLLNPPVSGGAAVLIRIANSLRSLSAGNHASVPLGVQDRVFADPIHPETSRRWSLAELSQLAEQSAGYDALLTKSNLYDTDLDTLVRQLELVAGQISTVPLTSSGVSNAALSWLASQLVVNASTPLSQVTDARSAIFVSSGKTVSFMDLMASAQRMFGAELAPRLEALGVLQGGASIQISALNRFLAWEKSRDPHLSTPLLAISTPKIAGSLSLSQYQTGLQPLQMRQTQLSAWRQVLSDWRGSREPSSVTQWQIVQHRLIELWNRCDPSVQTELRTAHPDVFGAIQALESAPLPVSTDAAIGALDQALGQVKLSLADHMAKLDVSTLDFNPVMGNWVFAQDQTDLIEAKQQQIALTDLRHNELRNAWNPLVLGAHGNLVPRVHAQDGQAQTRQGALALATWWGQSLASLSVVDPNSTLDPNARLFLDPATLSSQTSNPNSIGASTATRISLRQLNDRIMSALGIDFMALYAPPQDDVWTANRVSGLLKTLNEALGFQTNTTPPTTGSVLGSPQTLKELIVQADTVGLSIPFAMRAPLGQLLAQVAQLNLATDVAANGTFSAQALLFKSGPSASGTPNTSFDSLLLAGDALTPSLRSVLESMGILLADRVSVRGINALIDIARAEHLSTATPLAIAPASAQDPVLNWRQFQQQATPLLAQRESITQIQNLLQAWTVRTVSPSASQQNLDWSNWTHQMQIALQLAQDRSALDTATETSLSQLIGSSTVWVPNAAGAPNPMPKLTAKSLELQGRLVEGLQSQLAFDWHQMSRQLMAQPQPSGAHTGMLAVWGQVAQALRPINPQDLSADGSGANLPLIAVKEGQALRQLRWTQFSDELHRQIAQQSPQAPEGRVVRAVLLQALQKVIAATPSNFSAVSTELQASLRFCLSIGKVQGDLLSQLTQGQFLAQDLTSQSIARLQTVLAAQYPGSGNDQETALTRQIAKISAGAQGDQALIGELLDDINNTSVGGNTPAAMATRVNSYVTALRTQTQLNFPFLSTLTQGWLNLAPSGVRDTDAQRLKQLLEQFTLPDQTWRDMATALLDQIKYISSGEGTDAEKSKAIANAVIALQTSAPESPTEGRSASISDDLLGIVTQGNYRLNDLSVPVQAISLSPVNSLQTRQKLIEQIEAFLKLPTSTEPIQPAIWDGFGSDFSVDSLTVSDRNHLLAAIWQAAPELRSSFEQWRPPAFSADEKKVVDRMTAVIRQTLQAITKQATITAVPVKTETELRQDFTKGNVNLYTDRFGAFFVNGYRASPMDLTIVSRYVAQDQLSVQYKDLMDDMANRNNLITAAKNLTSTIEGFNGVSTTTNLSKVTTLLDNLKTQFGWDDPLSQLTSGKYLTADALDTPPHIYVDPTTVSTIKTYLDRMVTKIDEVATYFKKLVLITANSTDTTRQSLNAKYTKYVAQTVTAKALCNEMLTSIKLDNGGTFLGRMRHGDFATVTDPLTSTTVDDPLAWLKGFDVPTSKLTGVTIPFFDLSDWRADHTGATRTFSDDDFVPLTTFVDNVSWDYIPYARYVSESCSLMITYYTNQKTFYTSVGETDLAEKCTKYLAQLAEAQTQFAKVGAYNNTGDVTQDNNQYDLSEDLDNTTFDTTDPLTGKDITNIFKWMHEFDLRDSKRDLLTTGSYNKAVLSSIFDIQTWRTDTTPFAGSLNSFSSADFRTDPSVYSYLVHMKAIATSLRDAKQTEYNYKNTNTGAASAATALLEKNSAQAALDLCDKLLTSIKEDRGVSFISALTAGDFQFVDPLNNQKVTNVLTWLHGFDIPISRYTVVNSVLTDGNGVALNFVNWRTTQNFSGSGRLYSDLDYTQGVAPLHYLDTAALTEIKQLMTTLISNKLRDADLAQSQLQALIAQIQNNIEAMSALVKSFGESAKTLAQAL